MKLPKARRIYAKTISSQLVSVQPMKSPTGIGLASYMGIGFYPAPNLCMGEIQYDFLEYLIKKYGNKYPTLPKFYEDATYLKEDKSFLNRLRKLHQKEFKEYYDQL